MSHHKRFRFKTLEALSSAITDMDLSIPLSRETSVLCEPIDVAGKRIPNRIVAQPMEGADGTADGRPGELTYRRYMRVAAGGVGLHWFEATAVVHEGKGNPRQLLLIKDNVKALKDLLDCYFLEARHKLGTGHKPYTVLQLTHSGRYSKPESGAKPIIGVRNPYLDSRLPKHFRIIADEELEELEDHFADAAVLAEEIGFDAVDIKACHGYLISELLSAHTREGKYGGSYENRTRFLLNIVDKVQAKTGADLTVTVRLNAYDAVPYPHGWAVDSEDHRKYDLSEPTKLARQLSEKGLTLINITAGVPQYSPHVTRPYDSGPGIPPEDPLQGIERMVNMSREVQKAVPEMAVVASGLSWLRDFGAHCAAGGIDKGWFKLAGFGRQTLANPDFPRELSENGRMQRKKCCISCGKCSELMKSGAPAGCVVRDADVYWPIYRRVCKGVIES